MTFIRSEQIEKWSQYCQGIGSHDEFDFFTLFMDEPTVEDLKNIFSHFEDEKEALLRNFSRIIFHNEGENWSNKQIEELIKESSLAFANILQNTPHSHLSQYVLQKPIREVDDPDFVLNAKKRNETHSEIVVVIGDFVVDSPSKYGDVVFGLSEASYGLTNDTLVADFLIKPLVNANYDLSSYFEIWLKNVVYVYTDSEILFARRRT